METKLSKFTILFVVLLLCSGLFMTGCNDDNTPTDPVVNHPPIIQSVTASPSMVTPNGVTTVSCIATDEDADDLTYTWSSVLGTFPNGVSHSSVQWQGPFTPGNYAISVTVSDGAATDQDFVSVNVEPGGGDNQPPEPPFDPAPSDSVESQLTSLILSWSCSDPDGDPLTYDVYFGTTDSPPIAVQGIDTRTFNPGDLEYEQTYYWKVIAEDHLDQTAEGPVWSFTTEEQWEIVEQEFNLTDSMTITMVFIPAGSFMMGAGENEQESQHNNEHPLHAVNIAYDFWMSKYEVTQAQWEAVMGTTPSYYAGDNRPVERVSWTTIQEFETAVDNVFHLPSESEWEYACRAGTVTRYHWGHDQDQSAIYNYAVFADNNPAGTADVGTKLPNTWGLHDMSGNVREWVEDKYHDTFSGAPNDGMPWLAGGSPYRVIRGSEIHSSAQDCRSAYRYYSGAQLEHASIGFRLVRVY